MTRAQMTTYSDSTGISPWATARSSEGAFNAFVAAVPRSPGRIMRTPSPPGSPSNAPRRIVTPRQRAFVEPGGSNNLMASGSRPAQGSAPRKHTADNNPVQGNAAPEAAAAASPN